MYCITGTICSCGNVKAEITGRGTLIRAVQVVRPKIAKTGIIVKTEFVSSGLLVFEGKDGENGEQPILCPVQQRLMTREKSTFAVFTPCD